MAEPAPERCPVHAQDRPGGEWPCPLEPEPCPHFAQELQRRIDGMRAGNFWRVEHLADGTWRHHEYVNHEPTGRARTLGGDD